MWRQKKEGEGIFLRKASVEHERRELTPFPRAALALARVRFPLFLFPSHALLLRSHASDFPYSPSLPTRCSRARTRPISPIPLPFPRAALALARARFLLFPFPSHALLSRSHASDFPYSPSLPTRCSCARTRPISPIPLPFLRPTT